MRNNKAGLFLLGGFLLMGGVALFLSLGPSEGKMDQGDQASDDFSRKLMDMYEDVEAEYRPEVRWWLAEGLNTDKSLKKNIRQICESGFGAVEFLAMPEEGVDSSVYGWGSDEWISDSQLVVNEAVNLGLGFSLTSGAHWANANLPDTYVWNGQPFNADNIAASKELDYATILLEPGERYDSVLPYPSQALAGTTPAKYEEQIFNGVVAARLEKIRPECGQDYDYAEGTDQGTLDFSSLMDLSDLVKEQRRNEYILDWTAPDNGRYALFVFWMHGTGQTAIPSVSTNYTINYMDGYGIDAMIDYWNENILTDELRDALSTSGRGEIYMDSLEVDTYGQGGIFWGYHFKDEFYSRMGYDITPYLPLIVAATGVTRYTDSKIYDYQPADLNEMDAAEKIRNDYYQVMTDLYCENVLKPLQEWLHGLNMHLRAEPSYGFNFEISEPAAYLDDVETESYAQNADIDLYRGMLGSANMYGRLFSSETGAVRNHNYYFNMDQWTQLVYLQLVNGVNRTVFHGYSAIEGSRATAWPGHEGMYPHFSERFNERQPAYEMYPEWTAMIARNQKALRQGSPSRDIAILRTDYNFINYGFNAGMDNFSNNYQMNDMTYFWNDLELQQNGYTYDYFNPTLLLDEENVSYTSEALQPNGPTYQAIIVYQEKIDINAAKKLLKIAKAGLPVVFVNNNTENLLNHGTKIAHGEAASKSLHFSDSDELVRSIVDEIKALKNVRTVDSPADAMETLQELGVNPRVAFCKPNDEVLSISRYDKKNEIYYTFAYSYKSNLEKEPSAVTLSFDMIGKPYEIDDWSGKTSELAVYDISEGHTNVTISLLPGEAKLIALNLKDPGSSLHAVSTTADDVVLEDGKIAVRVDGSSSGKTIGSYETMLSNGKMFRTEVEVPVPISLPLWDIEVEDWNEGRRRMNFERKFGHNTIEVYYTTSKRKISFPESELMAWKDLCATTKQLSKLAGENPSMDQVSGMATYTATFSFPDEWDEINGAYLQIESTNGCQAEVYVNGKKAPGLDLRTLTIDISNLLSMDGDNTILVKVASTLTNRMIQRGYSGYILDEMEPQAYGMIGEVKVVPYVYVELQE